MLWPPESPVRIMGLGEDLFTSVKGASARTEPWSAAPDPRCTGAGM